MERLTRAMLWERLVEIVAKSWKALSSKVNARLKPLRRKDSVRFAKIGKWIRKAATPFYERASGFIAKQAEAVYASVERAGERWNRRGRPPIVFFVGLQVLLLIPVNIVIYAWECTWHWIIIRPSYLCLWLLLAGAMEAQIIWLEANREGISTFVEARNLQEKNKKAEGVNDGDNEGTEQSGGGAV